MSLHVTEEGTWSSTHQHVSFSLQRAGTFMPAICKRYFLAVLTNFLEKAKGLFLFPMKNGEGHMKQSSSMIAFFFDFFWVRVRARVLGFFLCAFGAVASYLAQLRTVYVWLPC
jgi:hypothetical protein